MRTIAIFVATTGGPAQIERLTPEYAPQSMVCLRRGSDILPISDDYDDFVKRGSGVIEREFGPFDYASFRMDVSANIGAGKSWQLAVFAAHALTNNKAVALADHESSPDAVNLLTGEVDYDLGIGTVGHIPEKIAAAGEFFAAWKNLNVPVQVIVPDGQNLDEVKAASIPGDITVIGASSAGEVIELLRLRDPASSTQKPKKEKARFGWAIIGVLLLAALGAYAHDPARFDALLHKFNPSSAKRMGEVGIQEPKVKTAAKPIVSAKTGHTSASLALGLSVFEQLPPIGETCAKVHFGRVKPLLIRISNTNVKALPDSSITGLCGLAFKFNPSAKLNFIAADLKVERGAYVSGSEKPANLSGVSQVSGQIMWSINLPRRMAEPLHYRLIAIFGSKPTLSEMQWLKQQSDWNAGVEALVKRGFIVLVRHHKVTL